MASTDNGVLTYHVVPRFDIAAKGGPLALGIIVTDLKRLIPLNRKSLAEVPEELMYEPVTQTDFRDTLAKAREANVNAWVKAVGVPVGGKAGVGGSKDVESTVSCESVVTTYFDPDPMGVYVAKSLKADSIQSWLEAAKQRTADLYLVTGLKVAKKLRFNKDSNAEAHAGAEASAQESYTNAVEAGLVGNVAGSNTHKLEFGVDDIVLGYRVNKYQCKRVWFSENWNTKDKGLLDGNMQGDEEDASQEPETKFELVPISEVVIAEKHAIDAGEIECWLPPIV
ncbi:uncharacterized protein K441DRAFT_671198 [Cenococcum geophilum 1.58]|uniref:Uncharacterized protein n=1 Tax=Cenococcum geophilum 1.58 TaxID=794803 RepID=A0ACC8ELF7_9PEZI|nr:hypothetical protein K441DRAFT_671198 [Cenococcum geophilum 1.58]